MATPTPSPSAGFDPTQMTNEELTAIAQQNISGMAAPSGVLTDSSKIYFGISKEGTPNYLGGSSQGTFGVEYSKARLLPTTWTNEQLRKFVNTGIMRKVSGFEVGMGMPEIVAAWDNLIQASHAFNAVSGEKEKKWTPFDILETYSNSKNKFGTIKKGDWEYDVATGERIRYLGKTTKTTTQRNIDLTSAEDAKALTTSVLTQALGRAPTAKEFAQFRSSINAMERATPTISTTTTQYNPNLETGELEAVSSDTTTSGGVTAEALQQSILGDVKETDEYGEYQSATTYWDAMMQMISGGS